MIEHDSGWHTTPKEKYGSFQAMYQGQADGLEEVFAIQPFNEYGPMMIVPSFEGVVYITEQQARAFFGFS